MPRFHINRHGGISGLHRPHYAPCAPRPYCAPRRFFAFPGEHIGRYGPTGEPHYHCRPRWSNPFTFFRPRPVVVAPAPIITTHRVVPISPLAVLGQIAAITGVATMILGLFLPPPLALPFIFGGAGLFVGGAVTSICAS